MKLLKRIMAVTAALLIAVNVFAFSSSAAFAAPVVAAEEFAEFLTALLLGAGHSQSEIDGMNVTQMQSAVTSDLNSGALTIDTPITDPVSGAVFSFYYFMNKPENKVARLIIMQAADDFVNDIVDTFDYSVGGSDHGGGGSSGTRDDAVSDYFVPTLTTDLNGYGAMVYQYIPRSDGTTAVKRLPCDYIVVRCNDDGEIILYKYCTNDGRTVWQQDLRDDGTWFSYAGFSTPSNFVTLMSDRTYKFFGDVRYEDGRPAPTDDEYKYVLGEADGTKITSDMLNPDGTVTIDGVTYYPADYLDPDKLTEEGKKQIINNISNVINNTYVVSDDKPIVDTDEITVEVAEELQDYAVPVGIANVFPFCIPWDIIRGFNLLNRPSVTPKFEIPFNIPEFGLFPGIKKSITLDFSEYDKYIQIFRWFQLIGFSFLLCKLSLTRVKGAGA